MSGQHTPGPWAVIGSSYDANCGSHYKIAQEEVFPSRQTWEANARLIAAAPDLLDALKLALTFHRGDVQPAWCEAARAAITKATGDAP